jgi:hypothetical protein
LKQVNGYIVFAKQKEAKSQKIAVEKTGGLFISAFNAGYQQTVVLYV